MNRVGRSRLTSAVSVTDAQVVTGSAYAMLDSLGHPYEIPYAVGQDGGGLLTHSLMYMQSASGVTPNIRVHFYAQSASGVTAGAAQAVDVPFHLGYVDHNAWVTAGGGVIMSQIDTTNLALWNSTPNNARSIWAALESRQTAWGFGATATPLRHKLGVLQD